MVMRTYISIAAAMLLASPTTAQQGPVFSEPVQGVQEPIGDDGRGTPYKVSRADSICGLDEPRALSNPAKVDYDAVLAATDEVKEIKKKRIDPDSAKGIKLMTEARRKVLAACETVRTDQGYCSIWKQISRRDRTPIDDVTAKVKAELTGDDEA